MCGLQTPTRSFPRTGVSANAGHYFRMTGIRQVESGNGEGAKWRQKAPSLCASKTPERPGLLVALERRTRDIDALPPEYSGHGRYPKNPFVPARRCGGVFREGA